MKTRLTPTDWLLSKPLFKCSANLWYRLLYNLQLVVISVVYLAVNVSNSICYLHSKSCQCRETMTIETKNKRKQREKGRESRQAGRRAGGQAGRAHTFKLSLGNHYNV